MIHKMIRESIELDFCEEKPKTEERKGEGEAAGYYQMGRRW